MSALWNYHFCTKIAFYGPLCLFEIWRPLGTKLYWFLWFFLVLVFMPSNWPRWPFPWMLVSSEKVWWSAGSDERYADQLFRESNLMKFTNKHYFNQEHFRQSRLSSTTLPPNALQDAKDVVFISKKQNKTEARSSEIIKPARWERKGFYWQMELPQWEGGRLFEPSAKFFYGNSCNFGTESRKMVSKVGN